MKTERWAGIWDIHGLHQHKPTVNEFLDFVKDYKPSVRIIGGDLWNFSCLRKSADDNDLREDPSIDFQAGCEFLRKFNPTVFLWGNHDHRLVRLARSRDVLLGAKANAETWIKYAERITPGCRHIEYNKRTGMFEYGDHRFLHGYSHGVAAGRNHANAYGNCCIGHVHRDETYQVPRIDSSVCHISGCACALDMDYNHNHIGTLGQSHGWLYGFKTKLGRVYVQHAKRLEGRWVVPTDFERSARR